MATKKQESKTGKWFWADTDEHGNIGDIGGTNFPGRDEALAHLKAYGPSADDGDKYAICFVESVVRFETVAIEVK